MQAKQISYLDLYSEHRKNVPKLIKMFVQGIEQNDFILGENLELFESAYAKFNETKFCVGVASGLDALVLSLRTLKIGRGDEVLVPSNTFIATPFAVTHVGATPVFVEPNIDTYNITSQEIEKKITKKTRAILPVHLYGQACEMDKIMAVAKKYSLKVIEDNAQSHGATFKGKRTGGFGDINATSFYPGKNLGALGDGGAVTTNSRNLYESVNIFHNYGSSKKYFNEVVGYNSRLDSLQAAFLSIKLKDLVKKNTQRQVLAKIYMQELQNIGDIVLPKIAEHSTHVFHIFCIRTNKRDQLQKYLQSNGIQTIIHYPVPPHMQKAYSYLGYKKGELQIAETLARTSLSLPLYPTMPRENLLYIVKKIKDFYKK